MTFNKFIGCATFLIISGFLPMIAQEESVKPGINESWKSETIDPLVDRLESESREIYTNREALAQIIGIKPGQSVADIGAGSGFMAMIFAKMVGPTGHVYAVDINPTMMDRVSEMAAKENLDQLKTVVCTDVSTELKPNSVDLIFICDTYHHFEYPNTVLKSIHEALRPGGQMIVVDFKRVEGESESWILSHVRAGKEVFTAEIVANGFKLVEEHKVDFLKENYILRFAKTAKP